MRYRATAFWIVTVVWFLLPGGLLAGDAVHAPLSPALLNARAVHIRIGKDGASTDVLNDAYSFFSKWKRFTIVRDPSKADIVVEITARFQDVQLNQYWSRGQVMSFDWIIVKNRWRQPLWQVQVISGAGQTKTALGRLRKEIEWHDKHGNEAGR